jgi:outer membrane autotransporter protein
MPDGSTAMLDPSGRIGAWIAGGARAGGFAAAVDRPEVDLSGQHLLGGLDYRFGAGSAVGVFGGYTTMDARLTPNSTQSEAESYFGGAYASAALGPVYLDAWGSYTDVEFDLARQLTIGAFSAATTAQTSGEVWAGGASAGLAFDFGGVRLEPFAALRYAKAEIDGFSETGTVAALNIGSQERESLRSNVGARLGIAAREGDLVFRPEIRGGWYHEFMDNAQLLTANFISPTLGGASFPFTVTAFDTDYYNAGASLDVSSGGPFAVVFDYEVQFDNDREIHAATAGARLAF